MLRKRGLALVLALMLALGWALAEEPSTAADAAASPEATEEWLLMLVNRDHPIPDGYEVGELVQLRGGQSVDRRIYPDLQAMFDAARAEGVYPIVGSGFRTRDEVYSWLAENAWQYGFILRYPEDKTDITGTIYEPWHYRYVGREAAAEIYASGLCLEEYLAQRSPSA